MFFLFWYSIALHAGNCPFLEQSALRSSRAHSLALLLHDFANLHGRVEELCGAAVEADGLALVELALAVVGGDALFLASLLQAVVGISHHAHLALDGSNLLLRGGLGTTDSEERHGCFFLFLCFVLKTERRNMR